MDNQYFICFWLLNFSLNIFPKIGFRQNVLSHFFRIVYLLTKETKIKTNFKVKLDQFLLVHFIVILIRV
jgi:hypothetical protein